MQKFTHKYSADLAMLAIVVVWGVHFVVLKDAFATFEPITFNALRYGLPVPFFLLLMQRRPAMMHLRREDWRRLLTLALLGPVTYQILFVLGIKYTSSTNAALLSATMPAWVAIINILQRQIWMKAGLLIGIVTTLMGVCLVILGESNAGIALSHNDLLGSALVLLSAILLAYFTVGVKPLLREYNSTGIALHIHFIVWIALIVVALPDLTQLQASDFSLGLLPHFLFSGLLASAFGRVAYNHGIARLGSTRAAAYQNLVPLVTAATAVLFFHQTLTLALLLGGSITLLGVAVVRSFSQGNDTRHPAAALPQAQMSAAD